MRWRKSVTEKQNKERKNRYMKTTKTNTRNMRINGLRATSYPKELREEALREQKTREQIEKVQDQVLRTFDRLTSLIKRELELHKEERKTNPAASAAREAAVALVLSRRPRKAVRAV